MASNVVKFKRRDGDDATPKGAQLEDGFFRVANELGEAFAATDLTSRQMRIVWAVLRLTYGWGRKTARITGNDLARLTGFSRKRCADILSELLERRVLFRTGSSRSPIGINKHVDQWLEKPARQAPTPRPQTPQIGVADTHHPDQGQCPQNGGTGTRGSNQGQCPQNGGTESPQNGGTYKDRKDRVGRSYDLPRESPVGASRDGEGDLFASPDDPPPPPTPTKAPPCPHQAILDLWAEIMPDKRQPIRSMWDDKPAAAELRARWRQCWNKPHSKSGAPLYLTTEEGITWWRRFFEHLRKSPWLMDECRLFSLDWVVRRKNFAEILEGKYHRDYRGGRQ